MYNVDRWTNCMEDLIKTLSNDAYKYVIENNLIFYDKSYPMIERDDLPKKYIGELVQYYKEIKYNNLYDYRFYIASKLKELYPNLKTINYTTVDPYNLSPKLFADDHIINIINSQDSLIERKLNIQMNFIDHFTKEFQDFIKYTFQKYDVVCFLRCCNLSLVIDESLEYIKNFKNILNSNGMMIHMSWDLKTRNIDRTGFSQPVLSIIPIIDQHEKRYDDQEELDKIHFLLNFFIEIQPGIYILKN